jgi:hypothetical protein
MVNSREQVRVGNKAGEGSKGVVKMQVAHAAVLHQ